MARRAAPRGRTAPRARREVRAGPWGRAAVLAVAGAAFGLAWNVTWHRGIFVRRAVEVAVPPAASAPAPDRRAPPAKPKSKPRPVVRRAAPSATALAQVRDEAATVRDIGLAEMKAIVAARSRIILDARSVENYRVGHIPGALDLPFLDFPGGYAALKDRLPKDREIVVYCTSGDCDEADQVIAGLKTEGYKHLLHFKEGWNLWDLNDLPEVKGTEPGGGVP